MEEQSQVHDESIRPLKRLRLKHQDNQASPSMISPSPNFGVTALKKPKVEVDEAGQAQADPPHQMLVTATQQTDCETLRTGTQSVPEQRITRSRAKQHVTSQSSTVQEDSIPPQAAPADESCPDVTKQPHLNSISSPTCLRARGKTPQSAQKEKISISERSSGRANMKETMVEAGNVLPPRQKIPSNLVLMKPKDEPVTDDIPQCEVPIAVILPGKYRLKLFLLCMHGILNVNTILIHCCTGWT